MTGLAAPPVVEDEWYARAAAFRRCEWKDGDGNRCMRMYEHFLDLEDPNHRVRLTAVLEYDNATGQLVETRYEP